MTLDIDIVVEHGEADVDRRVDLFCQKFYAEKEAVEDVVKTKSMCKLIHTEFLIKVDFVIRKNTEFCRTEYSRRRAVQIEEQEIFLVAPEELILS